MKELEVKSNLEVLPIRIRTAYGALNQRYFAEQLRHNIAHSPDVLEGSHRASYDSTETPIVYPQRPTWIPFHEFKANPHRLLKIEFARHTEFSAYTHHSVLEATIDSLWTRVYRIGKLASKIIRSRQQKMYKCRNRISARRLQQHTNH